jgi:hypothetical protein
MAMGAASWKELGRIEQANRARGEYWMEGGASMQLRGQERVVAETAGGEVDKGI